MKLESKKVVIQKKDEQVYSFLNHLENFQKLMPESIEKFEMLGADAFVFALKGMPEIALERAEASAYRQIVLKAKDGKIPFLLKVDLESISENETQVQFCFEGNFNPMMAMMIKSPIAKFIETLADKMLLIK
ncbi:SRPBCC family protein [Capnocytophaga canimorsus]|uniref:SRPBCC family protein n=1 Tax=Capnocytophaga canimorsus TaxID=28188 RepID=UPI00384AA408